MQGLYARQKCPKGSSCNFLHVFNNPQNLFASADRDLHRSPPQDFDLQSPQLDARQWRWSESPEHIPSSESDSRTDKKRNSRKRERLSNHDRKDELRKRHRRRSRSNERRKSKSAKRRRSKSSERIRVSSEVSSVNHTSTSKLSNHKSK